MELRQKFIDGLTTSASAHEAGQIWEIDGNCDELEELLAQKKGAEYDKLVVALEFWSGWIDARNHDWKFYDGISASDWPQLARLIAHDLKEERETEEERIRRHFNYRYRVKKPSIWQRLKSYLSGKR